VGRAIDWMEDQRGTPCGWSCTTRGAQSLLATYMSSFCCLHEEEKETEEREKKRRKGRKKTKGEKMENFPNLDISMKKNKRQFMMLVLKLFL
jgi:hypothetical protein